MLFWIIVLILIVLIALLICLIYTVPVELEFRLNSEMDMKLRALWLGVFKLTAELIDLRIYVSANAFGLKVFSGFLEKKSRGLNTDTLRVLSLSDAEIRTQYGLNEPHIAGILFGVLSAVGSMASIDRFEQRSDFISLDEYLEIEGRSKLNIGRTLMNYVRLKSKERKRRRYYGSVNFE